MSKEQTPMQELRENIERSEIMHEKVKLVLLSFDWDTLYKKEQQYANAKVLEALERYEDKILQVVEKKADVKDYILRNRSKTKI